MRRLIFTLAGSVFAICLVLLPFAIGGVSDKNQNPTFKNLPWSDYYTYFIILVISFVISIKTYKKT